MTKLEQRRQRNNEKKEEAEDRICERCGIVTTQDEGYLDLDLGTPKGVSFKYLCTECTRVLKDKIEALHNGKAAEAGIEWGKYSWAETCWCCGSPNQSKDYIELRFPPPKKSGIIPMGWDHIMYEHLCDNCGKALYEIAVKCY